jgi:hypothetical protein
MNSTSLQLISSIALGSTIVVSGIAMDSSQILDKAREVANGANLHQLATVIELYYSDYGSYPKVFGGEKLVNILYEKNYIMNRPLNPESFNYEVLSSGENYRLSLK